MPFPLSWRNIDEVFDQQGNIFFSSPPEEESQPEKRLVGKTGRRSAHAELQTRVWRAAEKLTGIRSRNALVL